MFSIPQREGDLRMKLILASWLTIAALALVGPRPARAEDKSDPGVLRVALLPDENASALIKKNEGLKTYLEKEIGKPIELIVTTDYSSMIEAMRRGRIELAYFGPLSYVLAKQRCDIVPFAAQVEKGSPTYHSVIIANAASGVTDLAGVKGKTVAWGDQASTSSHLIPKSILLDAGMTAGREYTEQFVGSHDAVAMAVQNGHAQVGGMSQPILERLLEKGTIKRDKIRVLTVSKPYPNYPWTMQSYLKPELQKKIREAFFKLKDPDILHNLKADGFAPVTDKEYDVVRQLTEILHVNLAKL
jgi:phosphonate transport system substrate-binding protein